LKEHEVFSLEDMLYAMIIRSANDAATALAIHIGGTKEAFVQLMNNRAAELGMKATRFASVHGLPPAEGQQPDVTTARDMSALALELLKHPDALKYTSTQQRYLPRPGQPFDMRSHNRLLSTIDGCDGLKTGYIRVAGFSITATAIRNNRRVVAVVLGSTDSKVRDAKAKELITRGFMNLPPLPPPPPAVTNAVPAISKDPPAGKSPATKSSRAGKIRIGIYIGLAVLAAAILNRFLRMRQITRG
jgi:D-alanyl-D-alanine carboxypeptidase (penicillin-binding protein 5/6)